MFDSATTNANPGNFAIRPVEEVKAIASMGGKASHGAHDENEKRPDSVLAAEGRRPDGSFLPGSAAAKEAGHHSHDNDAKKKTDDDNGRNEDGTFQVGSEAAKEAGHKGGMAS